MRTFAEIETAAKRLPPSQSLLDPGSGDYTATRQAQPDSRTMEDLCTDIRTNEPITPKK